MKVNQQSKISFIRRAIDEGRSVSVCLRNTADAFLVEAVDLKANTNLAVFLGAGGRQLIIELEEMGAVYVGPKPARSPTQPVCDPAAISGEQATGDTGTASGSQS